MDGLCCFFLFILSVIPIVQITLLIKDIMTCTETVPAEVIDFIKVEALHQPVFGRKRYKYSPKVQYTPKNDQVVRAFNKRIKVRHSEIFGDGIEKDIIIRYDPKAHDYFIIPHLSKRRILKHSIELLFLIITGIFLPIDQGIGTVLFGISVYYYIIYYNIIL